MKDWKYATRQEINNMTYNEACEIIQRHIDNGVRATEQLDHGSRRGTDFAPRAHMTKALQIIVDRADKTQKYEEFLWEIINETHKDHYGDPALAYSIICDMLSEVEEQMRE